MTHLVFRFATVHGQTVQWFLRRNCSLSPTQMAMLYGSLSALSLLIGVGFWVQGATLILPLAGLEMLLLGVAFLAHARHASDGERILLRGPALVVECENAGRLQRQEFRRHWVRVEPQVSDGSLIQLSGGGRKVSIGRFVRPELRPALAQEIREALRQNLNN